MMKKIRLGWMALMAFVVGALSTEAASVTAEQASLAVRGWVAGQDTFRARLGTTVQDVQTLTMTNGVAYHSVRMLGGGTVITSSDTGDEPIVAFTESSDDLSSLDHNSPLWALLNRDSLHKEQTALYVATVAAAAPLATKAALSGTVESSRRARSAAKWAALRAAGEELSSATVAVAAPLFASDTWQNKPYTATTISDVRVGPLLKTKWSQSTVGDVGGVGGVACWNYYTPCGLNAFNDGDADNMVCGCVATALSQVLRYFEFPTAEVTPLTKDCAWSGQKMSMTMKGGVYDWSKMTEVPTGSTPEENRREIGKLTHDAGVALKMNYNSLDKSGNPSGMSAAYSYDLRGALMEAFGYESATYFRDNGGMIKDETDPEKFDEIRSDALQRAIYSNLDAGLPVLVGITGHQVVADGYGYSSDGLDYVHINMGWAGSADYWYLLPILSYTGGGEGVVDPEGTMYFEDATYNVFTNASASSVVLSGRVLDDEGEPVASVRVFVYRHGQNQVVATATANEQGVYGVVVPEGTYDVEAKSDQLVGLLESVSVTEPTTTKVNWNDLAIVPTVYKATSPTALGNSWGNDLTLELPSVRMGGTVYYSLDKALADVTGGETVELLEPTQLRKPVTLAGSCTIVSTNADPAATLVTRVDDAALTIADGAALTLSNVVFSASDETLVTVEAGGNVTLEEGVVFGVATPGIAISTAATAGFTLAGALTEKIYFHCDAATAEPAVFGSYSCAQTLAEESAAKIICVDDENRETRGTAEGGQLKWKVTDVPVEDAAGYFVDGNGKTNAYARLDRVFDLYKTRLAQGETISEIVIRETSDPVLRILSQALVVTNALTIRGETAAATVVPTNSVRFRINAGGSLVLTNVVFRDYLGSRLFHVNGGEMTLAKGATLRNLKTVDGVAYEKPTSAGMTLLESGVFTMLPGSKIQSCTAAGDGKNGICGGGVCAYGGTLRLLGGTITGCRASSGGGAYVWNTAVTTEIGGDFEIVSNKGLDSDAVTTNNLYLANAPKGRLPTVVSALEAAPKTIGIGYSSPKTNVVFATVGAALDEDELRQTAKAFFCDGKPDYYADVEIAKGGATNLVWRLPDSGTGACDPWLANDLVIYGAETDRPVTNYYDGVGSAFAYMTNDCTLLLLDSEQFREDLTVKYNVRLVGGEPSPLSLSRAAECTVHVPAGASLTLTNICLKGVYEDAGEVSGGTNTLVDVCGGTFRLEDRSSVEDACLGTNKWAAAGVTVSEKGVFEMEEGSCVCTCGNSWLGVADDDGYVNPSTIGRGGGVLLLNGASACLRGGTIRDCFAKKGGALYAAEGTTVFVSGVFQAGENHSYDAAAGSWTVVNNMELDGGAGSEGAARVVLEGEYLGGAGVTPGVFLSDTNVFGSVSADWAWEAESLTNSAARFVNDVTGAKGCAVSNGVETLLVWSTALTTDETTGETYYEDRDGNRYGLVTADAPIPPPEPTPVSVEPIAFKSITRVSDAEWALVVTNRVQYCGYRLLWTDDLTKGFTATGAWETATADGEWATNVLFSAPVPTAVFWKAEGKDGEKMDE